jgi:hypothetical protein
MSRRKTDFINLSFLDVLTSGLGAVIFMFIISPKGENNTPLSPPPTIEATLYMDSTNGHVWGTTYQAGWQKGDTLRVVISEFAQLDTGSNKNTHSLDGAIQKQLLATLKGLNQTYTNNKQSNPVNNNLLNAISPTVNVQIFDKKYIVGDSTMANRSPIRANPVSQIFTNTSPYRYRDSSIGQEQKAITEKPIAELQHRTTAPPKLIRPSSPCKVAFEIKWASLSDNVDLYAYRGSQYVCGQGGFRSHKNIGDWDSGKSRNRIFGNDLRTNQEAIRQFDAIIAGEYKLFAHFKETSRKELAAGIDMTCLIYTKNEKNEEKSESVVVNIPLSKKEKFLIGTVKLENDGQFVFVKE